MNDILTTIRVIDFETTGFPPGAKAVEIGYCDLVQYRDGWGVGAPTAHLIHPGVEIPAEAMAIHHITDKMVEGAPCADHVLSGVFQGPQYFAAHNVVFDRNFAPASATNWICTLRCAQKLWPNLGKHQNQYIRYALGIDIHKPDLAEPTHRAGPDAYVTAHILQYMLEEHTLEQLVELSGGPAAMLKIPFGKYKGQKFADLPQDYLHWLTGSGVGDDIKAAARAEINKRAKE